jgi:phytoene synthase
MVLRFGPAGAVQSRTGASPIDIEACAPWGSSPRRHATPRSRCGPERRDAVTELLRLWMAGGARQGAKAVRIRGNSKPLDEITEMSRQRIENGSMSFAKAARLFPPELRASAFMLYAWCRHCDDEIDGQILGAESVAGLGGSPAARDQASRKLVDLRTKTLAALKGDAAEPVFIGLQRVVDAHQIPPRYPLDLVEGMAMDVRGRAYTTIDDTLSYAYYVAGVVGVMMATIMGVRDRATLERASDLGIAFQLTNIARDVVADAAQGRVYLPEDWLLQSGVPPCEVGERRHRKAVFQTTARLLEVADDYYRSAAIGIGNLPFRSAWAIASARRVYRGIGEVVRERQEAAWNQRACTSALSHYSGIAAASVEAAALIAMRRRRKPSPRLGLWTPSHLWTA